MAAVARRSKGPVTPKQGAWLRTEEVGALWGIRLVAFLCTAFGRSTATAVLYPVCFYFTLFAHRARRSSRQYLQRMGMRHGFWQVYRHVFTFAQCLVDRVFFLRGKFDPFVFESHGPDRERMLTSGQGAIVLGAHLGSFEALRARSYERRIPLNVVGNFHNARMLNAVLDGLGPNSGTRFIDAGGNPVSVALKAKECVDAGELVAILADRAGGQRSAAAGFLGAPALFPTGAFTLAAILKCPVYLAFGLYTEPNRYDMYAELFAEELVLPRGRREEATARYLQRFADRLEAYCRLAPYNWFNFFPFWEDAATAPPRHEPSSEST